MSYWELLKKAINKHKPGDFIYRTELVEKNFRSFGTLSRLNQETADSLWIFS